MPKDKDFKALVRARMAATGERFTQARAVLDRRGRRVPEYWRWLFELGDRDANDAAYRRLRALPPEVLRPLAVSGTSDPNWRVRRGCCRLLDDLEVTAESLSALETCMEDPEPRVRRAAVHSLTCERCKPDGCVLPVREIFERALRDPSRGVRQMVVGPLSYGREEAWRLDLLGQVVATDPSPTLRSQARAALEHFDARRRSNAERARLPAELRSKTERHAGKWVAISGGRIIDAGGHSGAMARTAHKHGHPDVQIYWVAAS